MARPIDTEQRHATQRYCRWCEQWLPISHFERYKTGTYRRVCRKCQWELYGRPSALRKQLRELEEHRK